MKIGVFIHLREETDVDKEFSKVQDMALDSIQLGCWDVRLMTKENADRIREASQKYGVEISAVWAGCRAGCEYVWNFYDGPGTIGLVPKEYRAARLDELKMGSDFAAMLGVTDVITHVGFLPENPNDEDFIGTVDALRELCNCMKPKGQYFLFETGQETPVTILRAIEEIGTGNVGVNLDTANLILYGKANPVDALDVFGAYVRNTHMKDGVYPTTGKLLGHETKIGEGKVDFPQVIKRLKELGYDGHLTIEREIDGEEQIADIILARDTLHRLLNR